MNYDAVTELALSRGFYFPSCEIYADAQAGFWEYGPLGVALKNRYIELWRRELVRRDGMLEIDGSQIMSKSVFIASGHLDSFNDPIVRCMKCSSVYRADRLVGEVINTVVPERIGDEELYTLIQKHNIRCPKCNGELSKVSRFNMMFKVSIGADGSEAYLRPETCQSIFVDFARLFKVMRCKLPIAIAQVGKSFRNEIAPRQSLIRLREFYQAEIEVFCNPKRLDEIDRFDEVKDVMLRIQDSNGMHEVTASSAVSRGIIPNRLIAYYLALLNEFYSKTGIDMGRTRFRRLADDEKAFYATVAYDFEVETSLGWLELVACNYRSDHDLKGHMQVSKENMEVMDADDGSGNSKVLPHVFELSMGVERSLYCILEHSLYEDMENDRLVLRLKPYLAPIQVGVLPIVKKDEVEAKAKEVFKMLRKDIDAFYDDSGSIGRRYRRLDEIGTPYAITIDRQTLDDGTVTIRDRDTMQQVRVRIDDLKDELLRRLKMP
ncbi:MULTISPECIES: glycine--tRNA ligase [Candidatus Nitrosocaldus]|jgi:glycyl-tRNA synthetase|uniref:glycine--tRNA ligase n=1 Tax=Candidatus Nitrosocaldus cavascurensis TaxID=2058097 RepID=A0A2K5ANV8_9ARCH|nr:MULTISPECIES: glycine--tRNA ligase [Candidatus Nitrosocaldus]SPC33317.1 Glycine--tRNA ligase [Candidatus Nitrosocaldus cavascurensis]